MIVWYRGIIRGKAPFNHLSIVIYLTSRDVALCSLNMSIAATSAICRATNSREDFA